MITVSKLLAVYVVAGKRKPVLTGAEIDSAKPLPPTFTHKGVTYHFSNADLVDGTATYVNVPLSWKGSSDA